VADKPTTKDLIPSSLEQNPSPVGKDSQGRKTQIRDQVDRIMEVFMTVLPSNYVSRVQGPFYTMQFQAAAEQIAAIQVDAQEMFSDAVDFKFTRSEFLFQIIGTLVFPDAETDGYPTISGDLSYREFLRKMFLLLLEGATKENIESGLALLSDSDFEVIERAIEARDLPGGRSAWGRLDQFTFEINVSEDDGVEFPADPFVLQENVRLVMRALKPAHTLYDYRHLFRETFGPMFTAELTVDWSNYYYEDFRRWCQGARRITGTGGITLSDRSLFSDPQRDFGSVSPGAPLTVLSGPNSIHAGGQEGTGASTDETYVGRYRVEEVRAFPVGDDSTPRAYTTSGGLSGLATVSGDDIQDTTQDFGQASEGELLTFSEGPNAGIYRLKTLLGLHGGPVGAIVGHTFTRVRVAPSVLRIRRRMAEATTGQSYEVEVDRMGIQEPRTVEDEDVTAFFLL